jgi:protein TonB
LLLRDLAPELLAADPAPTKGGDADTARRSLPANRPPPLSVRNSTVQIRLAAVTGQRANPFPAAGAFATVQARCHPACVNAAEDNRRRHMVHATHPSSHPFRNLHPDGKRIAGLAMAIVFNLGLFMLLAVPLHAPPGLALPDPGPILTWVVPKPKTPKPPVVPVEHHHAAVHHAAVTRPAQTTPVAPVFVQNDPMPAEASDPSAIIQQTQTRETVDSGSPLPGVRLEYADAPAPAYPREALRDGIEGTVLLRVLVDVDGRALQVDVQRSSGDRRLDLAARRQVLDHWRFRPAMKDGRAMQAIGLVPVAFHLQ